MTQMTKDEQGTREESFGFLIQTLAKRVDGHMKTRLKGLDVDLKIFANLMFLYRKDGITQREIGNHLNFPEYYTSRNVDSLIKAGFAERRPDPDSRRSMLVFLTPEGRQKAKQLPAVIREANDHILDGVSDADRKALISILQKVAGVAST